MFNSLRAIFTLWALLCIAVRFYLYSGQHNPQPVPMDASFADLVKRSARFDGCLFKGQVTVESNEFSLLHLLLLESMTVKDASGKHMEVIGDFAVPDPGETDVILTARFRQLANNSAFANQCILVFEEAVYMPEGSYTRR